MILNNIADFTAAVPTTAGMEDFNDFSTYVKSAELWLKNNVLGKNLYDLVDDPEFADEELLRLCKSVIANHAYWDAIPFLDLVHTAQGFAVISAANKVPASKERVERLRAQCMLRRDSEVENLIEYLEQTIAWHEAWKGSDVFSEMYDSLLPTLKLFRRYHNIADRATLDKLRSAIVTVQNTWIADVISKDYMDALVESQKDADFTPADNVILHMLRDAICKMALAWGIENMSIVINTQGVVTMATTDYYVGAIADAARLKDYRNTYKKAGQAMLDKVVNAMIKNIVSYPVFAASEEYQVRITPGYENTTDSPMFSSIF